MCAKNPSLKIHNVQKLLRIQKTCLNVSGSSSRLMENAYRFIYPNTTAMKVNTPDCIWRRFSPDGQYLVGFKSNFKGLVVYRLKKPIIKNMIISTTKKSHELHWDVRFSMIGTYPLDNVSFFVLDIGTGQIRSEKKFECDCIHLHNHAGVSLYEDLFSVLSVKNQTLHIMQIFPDGRLIDAVSIGENIFEDDQLLLENYGTKERVINYESDSRSRNKRSRTSDQQDQTSGNSRYGITLSNSTNSIQSSGSGDGRPTQRRRIFGAFGGETESLQDLQNTRMASIYPQEPSAEVILESRTRAITRQLDQIQMESGDIDKNGADTFNMLKQRMYAFIYREALKEKDPLVAVQIFYRIVGQYDKLMLWKSQFVSRDLVLLKFGVIPNVYIRNRSSINYNTNSLAVYMVYNIKTTQVAGVYDSQSPMLGHIFVNKFDALRAPMSSLGLLQGEFSVSSSLGNDIHFQDLSTQQQRLQHQGGDFEECGRNCRMLRMGGPSQCLRKAAMNLPFPPQLQIESPYFDFGLYKQNLRVRNSIEKNRFSSVTVPLRFYDRANGKLKFTVGPGSQAALVSRVGLSSEEGGVEPSEAELEVLGAGGSRTQNYTRNNSSVSYIVHPYLPLFISVFYEQGAETPVYTNIHFKD
ncbi:hypothetical protein BB559_001971 [Furculomyces boomerangus]|uniref:Uncharacterized protein n=1 Tax=Furculomyces boomerangus TaxID=61424 RepID=A0A2T9YZ11_9FUNG|nr:hypothetical protein BB559_001971 [Furculomyces boomerangus]